MRLIKVAMWSIVILTIIVAAAAGWAVPQLIVYLITRH